ncbi:NAD-dependent epimerase/dehydratase family protein [Kribbella sp. NPDC000426]|uniref:NAD-dependent epimerase/dehydratase family protein n=1 Tax=Kribbella sp. NPDC000426 TaxID=3154255 RepID=UPI00332EAC5B
MRVFVAGATGVIGRRLVPILRTAGHDVIGLARSPKAGVALERLGVDVVHADALDHAAMRRAVRIAAPNAVVHLLTRIPAKVDPKRMARDLRLRLRTEQARVGDRGRSVLAPSPEQFAPVLAAIEDLERLTQEAGGLVLRLGHLYGPGTIYAPDGAFVRLVRARKLPIVRQGNGTFSFTHTDDAAGAIAAALDSTAGGALNVVDDEPALVREWLPVLARLLNAPQPFAVPETLARLTIGSWGVAFMTRLRGADNAAAKRVLGWHPKYPSWRQGFATELAESRSVV